jgi:hypothetical protein
MAKKPEPQKPLTWSTYKLAAKAVRLGNEATAIEKGAAGNYGTTLRGAAAIARASAELVPPV